MNYKMIAVFALASMTVVLSSFAFIECHNVMTQFGDHDRVVDFPPDAGSDVEREQDTDADVGLDAGASDDSGPSYDADDVVLDEDFTHCDDIGCYIVPNC